MQMRLKMARFLIILTVFALGIATGCSQGHVVTAAVHAAKAAVGVLPTAIATPQTVSSTGSIEVAFSPGGGCTDSIVRAVEAARSSVWVQAYSFTSADIAKALVGAHRAGVDVKVILDKSQRTEKYSSATFLANAGISVKIDDSFAIAHNKVMIIDGSTVLTGSFNFTKSAEQRNLENLLCFRGNQALADLYIENWNWRWAECQPYSRN